MESQKKVKDVICEKETPTAVKQDMDRAVSIAHSLVLLKNTTVLTVVMKSSMEMNNVMMETPMIMMDVAVCVMLNMVEMVMAMATEIETVMVMVTETHVLM